MFANSLDVTTKQYAIVNAYGGILFNIYLLVFVIYDI